MANMIPWILLVTKKILSALILNTVYECKCFPKIVKRHYNVSRLLPKWTMDFAQTIPLHKPSYTAIYNLHTILHTCFIKISRSVCLIINGNTLYKCTCISTIFPPNMFSGLSIVAGHANKNIISRYIICMYSLVFSTIATYWGPGCQGDFVPSGRFPNFKRVPTHQGNRCFGPSWPT